MGANQNSLRELGLYPKMDPTRLSSGHRVPDLCLTLTGPLHQVFYSFHDPHHCPSYHTYHLHTMRKANVILHTNKDNSIEPRICPGFEFKAWHVNYSSQSNQGTDHLVSHPVSRLRVIRHNRTKHRESGTRQQNCFYLCYSCRLQHTFWILYGDRIPHRDLGPTIHVFDTGGGRSRSSSVAS
jgi:hypothetical protein